MRFLTFSVLLSVCAAPYAQPCNWGSFDQTRINYPGGMLTGTEHTQLVGIIEANGGTIATPTPILDSSYLGSVDVFYTSLLSTTTGALSVAEQTALQSWISGGGTLIVTGDIFPLAAYETFTSYYGVTNYASLSHTGIGHPVATHPITAGVSSYEYNTECGFTYGSDALLLGDNGLGSDFMIVMEEATGFTAGGRILVLADHNMFTNSYIGKEDNTLLATNIAVWACSGTAVRQTTWGSIKTAF
ncbi:hypothetical protein JW921_04410 [Candidatus Fermentibacterales bacterium]|nr:hypothetical protein [Candidatus Fermentibacterales bacterium]